MDAPGHYRRAEDLLQQAQRYDARGLPASASAARTAAQVHATLALAGATAMAAFGILPADDADAWTEAAGVPVAGEQLAPVEAIGGAS